MNKVSKEHDSGYKKMFSYKETFIGFLEEFVNKEWSKGIKKDDLVLIDKEFILEEFRKEEADIVYKAKIKDREVIFYTLIELQSTVDYRMPIRLLMYMTEIWRDTLRNTAKNIKKRKSFRLPPIIPIVIYNGKYRWTAAKRFKEIIDEYELFEKFLIDFEYFLFDINRVDDIILLESDSMIGKVFYLDKGRKKSTTANRFLRVAEYIRNDYNEEEIKLLKNWLEITIINDPQLKVDEHIKEALKKIKSSEEVIEMVSNLGKNIADDLRESKELGIKEGIEKGMEQEKIKIAKKLLDILDDETISKKTDLDLSKIKELRKEK